MSFKTNAFIGLRSVSDDREYGSPPKVRPQEQHCYVGRYGQTAEFKPVPNLRTGRFANVSDGSLMMTALTDPVEITAKDIPVSWSGSGYLQYDRKNC